jgi:hypothetical protein
MTRDRVVGRGPAARDRSKPVNPVAWIRFLAAKGASFWIGAIWASQAWWP